MLGRAYRWYLHSRRLGFVIFAMSMLWAGHGLSQAVAHIGPAPTVAQTRTVHRTVARTRFVTVHVKGHILRRYDHVLVVYVPRTTFRNHATQKRIVVPAHVVRIREPMPVFGVTSAVVIGVAPPAATIYVPVTVTIPGPTVTGPTTTITLPQATTTVTVPTTVTLPLSGE